MRGADIVSNISHAVSSESYRSWDNIPSSRRTSSRDIGWSSLLLDLHSGVSSQEVYESIGTADLRIGITLSGKFACDHYNKSRWRINDYAPGSIMLHFTEEPTNYRFPKSDDRFQLALIYLPKALVEACLDQMRRIGQQSKMPTFSSFVRRDLAIAALGKTLMDTMHAHGGELYASTTAAWMATHILSRYGSHPFQEDERSPGAITDARIERVLDYMSEHYADEITLDQLASEACVSKFHFTRLFKQKVGDTPLRILSETRIKAAHTLLLSSESSISQIARACGFTSTSHFTRAFSDRYGATPTAIRRTSRE